MPGLPVNASEAVAHCTLLHSRLAVASNSHRPLEVGARPLALEQRVHFCLSCLSRPLLLALNDSCVERLCGVIRSLSPPVCHCCPSGSSPVMSGGAAAWRSCAIPENSAANVDAVSRGASITSPPFAVRGTVRPEPAARFQRPKQSVQVAAPHAIRHRRLQPPRRSRARRLHPQEQQWPREPVERRRDDALDAGEEASRALEWHLVGRPVKESGEERLLGSDYLRDPRLDPRFESSLTEVGAPFDIMFSREDEIELPGSRAHMTCFVGNVQSKVASWDRCPYRMVSPRRYSMISCLLALEPTDERRDEQV